MHLNCVNVSKEQVPPFLQGSELHALAAAGSSQKEAAYPTGHAHLNVGEPILTIKKCYYTVVGVRLR